ncbi:MAG: hypothetical protein V4541_12100 [Bacteroidota bacterium]
MKKREKLAIIHQYYPNAITTIDSINKVIDFVEGELDLEPANVMLADSICSDDVNSIQYPIRASEFLGPFKMGGLDGFPFTGLTGMSAVASHVPQNGAVFVYYGPHIGVAKNGTIGEINRNGQEENSDCCGASKGALHKLVNGLIEPDVITEMDYQMNVIEQILYQQRESILASAIPLKDATEIIYEAIDSRINELISMTKFNCKYILLMGTIHINSDTDMGSFSAVKRFDLIEVATNERQNLAATYF